MQRVCLLLLLVGLAASQSTLKFGSISGASTYITYDGTTLTVPQHCRAETCASYRTKIDSLEAALVTHGEAVTKQGEENAALRKLISELTTRMAKAEEAQNVDIKALLDAERAYKAADDKLEAAIAAVTKLKGPKGDMGEKGEKGDQGERGEQGLRGKQGQKGDQGEQGAHGEQGVRGKQGEKGEKGADGARGEKGEKGEQGERGAKGEPGQQATLATAAFEVNFAGPANKYTGSGGAYCPSDGENQVAYMDSLITSRDFEVTFSPSQITCGAGIVLGFAFASSAGKSFSDSNAISGKDPELRSGFSRPRVAISTVCDPAGKMQFWEYSAGRQGGRGNGCNRIECRESIEGASAGDTIGLKRVSHHGRCVISVTKNGKIIKTANSHEFEGDGCGSGYLWMGNYNSGVKQCFSALQVTVGSAYPCGIGTCAPEAGCTYSSDICVCKSRCPAGWSRLGDGSACGNGAGKSCDLGHCHGNPNTGNTYASEGSCQDMV